MAAPFSASPPDPAPNSAPTAAVASAKDNDDDAAAAADEENQVRNALLLTSIRPAPGQQQASDPSGARRTPLEWWTRWRRRPPSVVVQTDVAPVVDDRHSAPRHASKKHAAMNHQNNYVSVNVSASASAAAAAAAAPADAVNGYRRRSRDAKWCSLASWRPREKWLLVTLVLVSAACLAFITMSLVALLRQHSAQSSAGVCFTEECVRTAASLLMAMNRTADPCQDFFQFACGAWNKKHLIPEDRSSISTFEVLADQLQIILKGLLEEEINDVDNGATVKAKMFYKSCMNTSQIRETSDKPLRAVLQALGGWPVLDPNWTEKAGQTRLESVESLLGRLRGDLNQGVLVEQWVGPDDKNSSVNIIQLDQMQLGLPGRDYYLKSSSLKDLKAYHRYMTDVAVLLGADKRYASEEMRKVVQFETLLANVSIPEADRQDTGAIYEKMSLAELERRVPEIRWRDYLNAFLPEKPVDDGEPIVSYAMSYFRELGKLIAKTERRVVQNYALWRLIMDMMPHLPDEYQEKRAEFRRVLLGVLSERNRWNQCVEWTNKKLGMAVGALFIRENFNQESKAVALEMIHTLREAFIEILDELEWMDEETRQVARQKALAMNERIGYPELLTKPGLLAEEYALLNVSDAHFLQNILNIKRYEAQYNLHKLRQSVAKDKWSTEPAVVNAFYNPNKNDIVFPAGILQPLFYSSQFPKSLNYGGIGVVIGHEITHGFDDKGRQFDKDGNLKQWWNNATVQAFRHRTQCIIDQYSNYRLEDVGLHVNGRMTQGENIADNGGLKQAYRAYRKWVGLHGEEPLLPGMDMSHDQLFFLNYAQIWCGTMRPEDALTKIRSSVHSPGPIRVLGPLSNSPEFAKAYNCPLDTPMNPRRKCSVW